MPNPTSSAPAGRPGKQGLYDPWFEHGACGVGLIFLPRSATVRRKVEEKFEQVVQAEGCAFLGWRTVPVKNASLGDTAKSAEPFMRQAFIARPEGFDERAFERRLY